MASLLHCLCSRNTFTNIWNRIAEFDANLQKKGYVRSESQTKIWAWIVISGSFIIWFSVNQAGMIAFFESWFNNVSYMMLYVASSVAIFKFIGVTYCLGRRFAYLNQIIGKNESSHYDDNFKTEIDTKVSCIIVFSFVKFEEYLHLIRFVYTYVHCISAVGRDDVQRFIDDQRTLHLVELDIAFLLAFQSCWS